MKVLVVEDDFVSRRLLITFLTPYGECDYAVDGVEAMEKFLGAVEGNDKYDLICLDIMMPEMDGQEVLSKIREYERSQGIKGFDGVKIIMVSVLRDFENIRQAFNEQCEAYLPKPVIREKLIETIRDLGLIDSI